MADAHSYNDAVYLLEQIDKLNAERNTYAAQLVKVRTLHRPNSRGDCQEDGQTWPCTTLDRIGE